MVNKIKVKKGLDINLKGKACEQVIGEVMSATLCAVEPDDFVGLEPKLAVKVGDRVLAGSPLMYDKSQPSVKIASPVSGEVIAVNRGERRKILSIEIKRDATIEYISFPKGIPASGEEVKNAILDAGMWWTIKQRPFDVIANPAIEPRDIFVSGFDSAPLAPNSDFVLATERDNVETGLKALALLTKGKVIMSIHKKSKLESKAATIIKVKGPHPAGNVGVLINQTLPVNKGETVWTLSVFEVALLGRLFNQGKVDLTRTVAITGSEAVKTGYVKTLIGTPLSDLLKGNIAKPVENKRIINGNVLTGTKSTLSGSLSYYSRQITIIPEGEDCHEFFGWITPGFGKLSVSRTFFSWLCPKKEYVVDARLRGGERGIIMSGEYESVFPMDVMPEQLIKATLAFDIEKMENLGIYEVAPEDFALCEFVDTSKLELQYIIRTGLDKLKKEVM